MLSVTTSLCLFLLICVFLSVDLKHIDCQLFLQQKRKKKKGERNERKKGWQGDLIGISRELESRVCSHSEPLTSEEELFTGVGKEDAWAAVSNVTMAFHRLIVVRKGAFIPC